MRAQLERILEIAALPNVTLQVMPFDTGAHASMGTSFELLQFPEAGDTAIVYIEDQTSSQYLETGRRHRAVYARVRPPAGVRAVPRSNRQCSSSRQASTMT